MCRGERRATGSLPPSPPPLPHHRRAIRPHLVVLLLLLVCCGGCAGQNGCTLGTDSAALLGLQSLAPDRCREPQTAAYCTAARAAALRHCRSGEHCMGGRHRRHDVYRPRTIKCSDHRRKAGKRIGRNAPHSHRAVAACIAQNQGNSGA